MSTRSDLKLIQARWVLGLVPGSELPSIATSLLCEGVESKCLIELAGLSPKQSGGNELFERALDELGLWVMEPTEALRRYAKAVSGSILAGEISPLEGAKRIWNATLAVNPHGWHELDAFIYAASEADSRPEDQEFFEKAIVEEARRWSMQEFL